MAKISYIKKEVKLHYLKKEDGTVPTAYKIKQQSLAVVNFQELVNEVVNSCSINSTMTKAVIEGLINRLCHFMSLGHAVQMGEFGTFKPTISVKTQKSEEDLGAKNIKSVKIRFYPGKRFKSMLANITFEAVGSGNIIAAADSEEDKPENEGSTDDNNSAGNGGSNQGGSSSGGSGTGDDEVEQL